MKWVLCDQGNFRPRRFIDRTCQPTVEPETSLGVQASKAVHQCLFSRIAWRRKRATNHFLNQFGKTEAESKSHLFKRKKHPKHPQILRVFPYIFRTFHIYPHLGSTTFSTRRRLRWPMRQAHACGAKASHGRGNLRSWHRYTGTSSRLGRGRLLAIFSWPNLQNHLNHI